MSNVMRFRYDGPNHLIVPVDSATVIEIGDLLYLDTDDAKPASSQSDQGTETLNQQLFRRNWLGIAMQQSRNGDTDAIRVAIHGVFEMPCVSATYEIGDLLAVDEASSGTALEDQKVVKVTTHDVAIGRVARREASAATNVLFELQGTIHNRLDEQAAAGQAAIGAALTDNSGGTADTTIAAVSGSGADATINNNFADLADRANDLRTLVNQLRTDLINLGLIKGAS